MVYICNVIKGQELEYDKRESKGIGYFSNDDIKKLPMFPNFKNLLGKFLSKNP